MVNKVFIIGNLGKEVELKQIGDTSVARLTVATSEKFKKDGQLQDHTEWHNVNVWGSQAENCAQYLVKGQKVYVEGKLRTRSWEDQSGSKRYATEILATTVQFLEKPKGEKQEQKRQPVGSMDDIPF